MRSVFFVSITMILSGCTVVHLPSSTGQIPEVGGDLLKGRVGIDIKSSVPIIAITHMSSNQPRNESIYVGYDSPLGTLIGRSFVAGSSVDLNLGILERLDVYYIYSLGLRYMFWGEPQGLGWRSTVFAGPHNTDQTDYQSTHDLYKAAEGDDADTQLDGIEFGISIGKKISDTKLHYVTLAGREGDADITVNQSSTSSIFQYKDDYTQYMATLGGAWGNKWYLKSEISATYVRWSGLSDAGNEISDSSTLWGYTLGYGYRF